MSEKIINVNIDILEEEIQNYNPTLLNRLLKDKTTGKNIIWATDDYSEKGEGFAFCNEILPERVTGMHARLIQPRITKSKENQTERTKDKAEVFTPSWVCNSQNNLVDAQWFGRAGVFNVEKDKRWKSTSEKIEFSKEGNKTWEKYVDAQRLEMTCGEAPYLVSRYDTVTGEIIPLQERVGLLDRKLRVVGENTETEEEWLQWAQRAFESVYGFEYQGDSLLLARENLFATFIEYYQARFKHMPSNDWLKKIANIISWNIWQMDGIKMVVPESCHDIVEEDVTIWGRNEIRHKCPGCISGDNKRHNGMYCKIQDWRTKTSVTFLSMIKEG